MSAVILKSFGRVGERRSWAGFGLLLALLLIGVGWAGVQARAQTPAPMPDPSAMANEGPLTQGDIDGYVYLTPRLAGPDGRNPDQAAAVLKQSGLTRRRAVYVGAKVAVTQALVSGLMSPGQLEEQNVPPSLRPSTGELQLVTRNLGSLVQAQSQARRAAAQPSN